MSAHYMARIAAAALLLIPVTSMAADTAQVEQGRYLGIVGDCAALNVTVPLTVWLSP